MTLLIVVIISVSASPGLAADTYQLDPVHSSLVFRIKHLGVANVWGRINSPSGTIVFDEKRPQNSSVTLRGMVKHIDTNNDKRDAHLRSTDFFNAKKFPEIVFISNRVEAAGGRNYRVTGDFSMHGVTKSLTVDVAHTGSAKDPWGGYRSGFETVFEIKRSDFGMNFMQGGVGDTVTINVAVEAIRN
jgi:polyisoprenoid-binding protein YceI